MCSQVRVKCSSEHHVSAILQMETSRGTGRHSLKLISSLDKEWDTLHGEMQKRKKVRERQTGNKGAKQRWRLLTKFQYTMTHYSTSVCLAGWHVFTPQQLPSAVEPTLDMLYRPAGWRHPHNLRLTLFVSQVSLSAMFYLSFPKHHNKH